MEKIIVLLRGINVGGHRRLPMAELRAAAQEARIGDFETYIQSGNLIFSAENAAAAEDIVEALVEKRFGLKVEAIARTASQWAVYAKGSPFPDADERGNLVHLGLSKQKPNHAIADILMARAAHGETVVVAGDALWIDFKDGVANTRLSPAFLDKALGSTVTMRNWRTVLKLAELAEA
ncbi:DUF1697 domain-containing protein [Sphingomonas sp. SRS2]|uniref:DUF1697 domain-containing protein n=1 Tax=Sphingomonas sp. SRS2 TaxID=133190 RepID=UPI0006184E6B|nr:DUF1697 domain-containing protein [Sphingomonas sp. SRS2]KKC26138.1 hypothetical protein WP12_10120 [Sphingomonas sp. SRS2]